MEVIRATCRGVRICIYCYMFLFSVFLYIFVFFYVYLMLSSVCKHCLLGNFPRSYRLLALNEYS